MNITNKYFEVMDLDVNSSGEKEFMLTVKQDEMNHLTKETFEQFKNCVSQVYEYLYE